MTTLEVILTLLLVFACIAIYYLYTERRVQKLQQKYITKLQEGREHYRSSYEEILKISESLLAENKNILFSYRELHTHYQMLNLAHNDLTERYISATSIHEN